MMDQKRNVLLVTSAAPSQTPFSTSEKRPPIGIGFLISVLRNAGHNVFFIDNYLTPSNFLETDYLQRNDIDFVGIYANTICYRDTLRMLYRLDTLRRSGQWKGQIIVGGPHATVALDTIPGFVDHVVQGEGEGAILDIIDNKVAKRVLRYPRIRNLDKLPMPAWDYFVHLPYNWGVDWFDEKPIFTMNTSRGCPFQCAFCSVGSIWGKQYTYFSAERIVEEIELLIERYKVKGIYFREDNFTLNRKRLATFCNLLIKKGINICWACESRVNTLDERLIDLMCRAGLRAFYFGVESGSQRVLDFLKKRITVEQIRKAFTLCAKYGVKAAASIIVGVPTETEEELLETEALIREIKPAVTWHNVFVGIPNSQLCRYAMEKKLYEFIDDRGLVYLKGHNDRVKKFYGQTWDALIPFNLQQPKISVVMSVYNGAAHLENAVSSILKQTYSNFELLILDDASTDATPEVLGKFDDPRIRMIRHSENLGLTKSLNLGIEMARGEYIARMDADDISHPFRFEKQVTYLDANPECLAVGTWTGVIRENGRQYHLLKTNSNAEGLMVSNVIVHGSTMIRKSAIQKLGGYDEQFKYAQDYDLWLRMSEIGVLANLQEELYYWRYRKESISIARKDEQDRFAELARAMALERRKRAAPKSNPLVSVIVPTFNRPVMLVEAIRSIQKQTYQNVEIIIVNDCGTDVESIISSLNRDHAITYVKHGKNKGLAAARNTGIKIARGKYVAYLDDDDVFYPEHVETLVRALELGEYEVAYTDAYRAYQEKVDGQYVVTKRDVPYSFNFDYDRILRENFIPVLCIMHKRSCLDQTGLFDESLKSHEDWDLWIRMSRKFRFGHIKKITCEFSWRTDGTSMTSAQKNEYAETRRMINEKHSSAGSSCENSSKHYREVIPAQHSGSNSSCDSYPQVKHLKKIGKKDEAIEAQERAIANNPIQSAAFSDLGHLYYEKGDKEKALLCYEKAYLLESNNTDYIKDLADFYYVELKRVTDAFVLYEKILTLNPLDKDSLLMLGNLSTIQNKFEKAQEFFLHVLEIDPVNEMAGRMFDALDSRKKENRNDDPDMIMRQARSLSKREHTNRAIAKLEKLIESYPDHPVAHNDLGFLYYRKGEKAKACIHYEKAVAADQTNVTALKNLADFYLQESGQAEQSLRLYTKVLQKQPGDVEALRAIGLICVQLERYEDAIEIFQKIQAVDSTDTEILQILDSLARILVFQAPASPTIPHPTIGNLSLKPTTVRGHEPIEMFGCACLDMAITPIENDQSGKKIQESESQGNSHFTAKNPAKSGENINSKDMKFDWNNRAKKNAKFYVHSINQDQSEEEFNKSGLESVKNLIVDDLPSITQGKDPKGMKVLEIGCGIGRMTKYLAQVFGEVYGVDVSREMIRIAKDRLRPVSNVWLAEGSGKDLAQYGDTTFDFVFSFIVFQHIPYRKVILDYIKEAHRVLKLGGIFKFQVQGCTNPAWLAMEKDTWHGETITEEDIDELSSKHGYEIVEKHGQGTQYSFFTLKKCDTIDKNHYSNLDQKPQLCPVCSIVIPVFNRFEFTHRCISAIQKNTPKELYEVIVVDNASTDATSAFLTNLHINLRSISNSQNVGFTLACNQGAKIASEEFVVFLNNDTEPQQGWLDSMIELARSDATIGVVGSKLIYPDGRLQEAGGIVFNDGSAWNYGRFGDPEDPSFNFVREVDYVSGAALLVRHDLLKQLNYFDEQFSPGYYEDTDLCFGIRSLGYKVMYCPFSVVVHHEGISSGTDLKQGMKKYQTINRDKFVAKWATALRNQCRAAPQNVITASEHGISGNILIIDPFLPMFDRASGSLRLFTIISLLRTQGYHITFIARNGQEQEAYSDALRKMGVEVYATDADMLRQMGYAVLARPFDLKRILAARRYQFAILSFYDIAEQYLPIIRSASPETRILIDTVDIHFVREMRQAELSGDPVGLKRAAATKERELSIYSQADGVITVTERDWDHIGTLVSGKSHFVIPNIHAVSDSQIDLNGRKGILFVGNFNHTPNIDAMRHFIAEIFPIVQRALPQIKLTIVGNNPPKEILALMNDSVVVMGYVPSIEPYLRASRLSIAPLRYGAGMKGKIGEAMAHGLPVVTTSIGAEGMGLVSGKNALIADSPNEFADHIIELCTNDETWHSVASAARQFVLDHFSPQKVNRIIAEMIRQAESIQPMKPITPKHVVQLKENVTVENDLTSIVILTLNQLKYTRKCVQSIQQSTPEPHEIIFIDNGSRDGTVKWLKRLVNRHPNYQLIENSSNLGFSKGCNQGIDASTGDHILLLNNDVVVTKDWLSGLLECLHEAADIGIVGPMTNAISGPQKVPSVDYSSADGLAEYSQEFRLKNRNRRIPNRRVVGFCMLFKRQLIEEIGLLDESFGSGNFEDDDFCLRASLAGYRNVIAGDVFIHHYGSRTFVGNRIDYGASLSGNRKVFTVKWSGKDAVQRFGKKLIIENAITRADEFFQKGDIENATASMLEALKQAPDDRSLYFRLAEMLIDAKRYNDALGILESMHQVAANARRLALLGYCEEGLGHDEKANEYVERALAIDPSMPLALNILGVLAHKRGEQETAEALFKKAIESDTGFGESYTNLGSLKWAAGEDIEALNSLERGFILSPTIADVATAYHAAVVETRSFERAEPVFREAKALHPKNKRIAFLMIALLIQQEKNKLAMQEIENAMIQFGIDDGILSAGLEIRKKIGFLEVDKSNRKKATLSLCMIARNEEPHLAKCLMSVKPIVNEMIVVDTGSSDRTKNIAAALGAKVFDYPWTNDFSEARNYSLSKASGDWILVLDADEVVSPLDYHKLLDITVRRPRKPVAYTVLTRNYTNNAGSRGWVANEGRYAGEEAGKGWVPSPKVRLFVNDRRIQFVNPVHELVEPTLAKLGIKVKACDVPVHHYGRLDQDKLVAKGKEYYRLGIAKIEQTKGDYNALKELAIQASEIGEYEAAVNVWQKVIEIQSKDAVAYMNMGFAFLMMRKYDRAIEFSKIAMELDPELREAALNYSAAEMIAGDVRTAISTLEDLLEKNADYPPAMGRLAAAYMVTGRKEEGFRYLDKLKSKGFDCASALEEQSRSFIAEGKIEPAAVLLKSAIEKGIANGSINDLFAECRSKIDCSTPTCKPIDFKSSLPLQTAELQRNTATI